MTTQIISVTFKLKRGSSDSWSSTNPVLAESEPGYDTTNKKLKIGDGVSRWNDLGWVNVSADSDLQAHIDAEEPHPAYDTDGDGPSLALLWENAKV